MKPSRTFTVSMVTVCVLALVLVALAVVALVMAARSDPNLGEVLITIQVTAGCLTGSGAAGAGSMALRDYASRGLTSSQGDHVLKARRAPVDDLGGP